MFPVIEDFPHIDRRLLALVVVVGLAGGLVGAAYVSGLHLLETFLAPEHQTGWLQQLLVLAGAGGAIGLLIKLLCDPGDVELLVDNIHVSGGSSDARALRSLIPASLVGIAAGSALGPEAPLVQTGGVIGTLAGRHRRVTREQTRVLAICGMASAFAVLFGAPLGSAVFALEILHRRGLEYYEALFPAVVGSLSGYAVYLGLTGVGLRPIWDRVVAANPALAGHYDRLKAVNEQMWDVQDGLRAREAARTFDEEFIALARAVAVRNGERIAIKNAINRLAGSEFVEEKQYQAG